MVSARTVRPQERLYEIWLIGTKSGCGTDIAMPLEELGQFFILDAAVECSEAVKDWLRRKQWSEVIEVAAVGDDGETLMFTLPDVLTGLGARPNKVGVFVLPYGVRPDSARSTAEAMPANRIAALMQ